MKMPTPDTWNRLKVFGPLAGVLIPNLFRFVQFLNPRARKQIIKRRIFENTAFKKEVKQKHLSKEYSALLESIDKEISEDIVKLSKIKDFSWKRVVTATVIGCLFSVVMVFVLVDKGVRSSILIVTISTLLSTALGISTVPIFKFLKKLVKAKVMKR